MGGPSDGSLKGGFKLPTEAPGLFSNPKRPNASAYFGTAETILSILFAAKEMVQFDPSTPITVNDIGFEHGGPIAHHGSHQSGRDVDILLFMRDMKGQLVMSKPVPFDPSGIGTDFNDLENPKDDERYRFDAAHTWQMLSSMLTYTDAPVQRFFLATHLRTSLVTHARSINADERLIRAFVSRTCQPSGSPHDDHVHVRYYCSAEDLRLGCMDAVPVDGWRAKELEALGLAPITTTSKRKPPKAPSLGPSNPPMHASVTAFLEFRKTWIEVPPEGRCKMK